MSAKWMQALLRARQAQERIAAQRAATARRAAARAHDQVHADSARIEEIQAADAAEQATAFVAAGVALQSAAAVHAIAVGDSVNADRWAGERQHDLRTAAMARRTAEQLHDRAAAVQRRHAAELAQREQDEIAAARHRRAGEEHAR